MEKSKKNKILIDCCIILAIVIYVIVYIVIVNKDFKNRFSLTLDERLYCYGVDSLKFEEDCLKIKGWFIDLKGALKKTEASIGEDGELMLALVPLNEANVDAKVEDALIMDVETMHENRPDIDMYFSCEYDYSKCGFTAYILNDKIDWTTTYRLAVKTDATKTSHAVLTNIYLSDKGISYIDPAQEMVLDTVGTELDRIVKEGILLVSRPDFGCCVYQFGDKLYWIADDSFTFCDNATYIQYQLNTTQLEKLPEKQIEKNKLYGDMSFSFERYEITNQINCGQYRVSEREIPRDYSVTDIWTGYFDEKWIWSTNFKPNYSMLINNS